MTARRATAAAATEGTAVTIWEAAMAAYQQRLQDEAAAAEQARQERVAGARAALRQVFGPDVTLPPHDLIHPLGVVIHDGQRGLLFTEQAGQQIVRYVVREGESDLRPVGDPVTSPADLGALLTTS